MDEIREVAMAELTSESLAARVAELGRKLVGSPSIIPATRDWRSVVGISEETDFSRSMLAEMAAHHEAESNTAVEVNE